MKKCFSLLTSMAVFGLLCLPGMIFAEPMEGVTVPDPAFEAYVSPELMKQATDSEDPELLTDVALQLMEGERVLQRPHLGISGTEVMRLAYRLATEEATKTRLKKAAEKTGQSDMLSEFAKLDQEVEKDLAATVKPTFSTKDNPEAEQVINEIVHSVDKAVKLQDRLLVTEIENNMDEFKDLLDDTVTKEVKDYLDAVKTKIPEKPNQETDSLDKLSGVSRQMMVRPGGRPSGGSMSGPTYPGQRPQIHPSTRPNSHLTPRPPVPQQGNDRRGPFRVESGRFVHQGFTPPAGEHHQAARINRQIPANVSRTIERLKNGSFEFRQTPTFRMWTQSSNRGIDMGEVEVNGVRARRYQMPTSRQYNPNGMNTAQWIMWASPLPPNGPLSPWRMQVYQDAVNASANWGIDYPISPRTGLQFFPDSNGVIVVGMTPWSPLKGKVKIGDYITAVDNMPINMPWDMEMHYRWTWFEHIDLDSMWWQNQPAWLGLF